MMQHSSRSDSSGNIMILLLGGIILAGSLSYIISQMMSGPMLTITKVARRVTAEAEMESIARMIIVNTGNLANSGDCDSDSSVEPPEWRATAGAKPTGAGLLPLTIGSVVTDPWGTDYGYCVWDVGSTIRGAGCGGVAEKRLQGTPSPTDGKATTQTLFAIVSAGPDKQFQTTCAAYTNANTDQISTSGDDRVLRYTYSDMATAASSLWQIKPGTPSTATIGKNLEIGDSSAIGSISSLSLTTVGKVNAGGGARPADETVVTNCDGAAEGLLRYNDSTDKLQYCDGTSWVDAGSGAGAADIDGMSDGAAEYTLLYNVFLGLNAGANITTGEKNTGVGYDALTKVEDGDDNTAMGYQALRVNRTGDRNTALGWGALLSNTTGSDNVAGGYAALYANITGSSNIALGTSALFNTTAASNNVAIGANAGTNNSLGDGNVMIGHEALTNGSNASYNVAIGTSALKNATGDYSVAIGQQALQYNVTADYNIGIGYQALTGVGGDIGLQNIAVGAHALTSNNGGLENAAFGAYSLGTSQADSYNVAFGYRSMGDANGANYSTAFGYESLPNATMDENTAMGYQALYSYVEGTPNTAVGAVAMAGADRPRASVAIGYGALYNSTSPGTGAGTADTAAGVMAMGYKNDGAYSVAVGAMSLLFSPNASYTIAVGSEALYKFRGAGYPVAVGFQALGTAFEAIGNTAVGYKAAYKNDQDGASSGAANYNTAVGYEALLGNIYGERNTAVGLQALNTSASFSDNTAVGYQALASVNEEGNVAVGAGALSSNRGRGNVGVGYYALYNNADGYLNTAVGYRALHSNISGYENTAVGSEALFTSDSGFWNTALGYRALYFLNGADGSYNTAIGFEAAFSSSTDVNYLTAIGYHALRGNATGLSNTAVGAGALATATGGNYNTAMGAGAMQSGQAIIGNTVVGASAGTALAENHTTVFGADALSNGSVTRGAVAVGVSTMSACTGASCAYSTAIGFNALSTPTTNGYNTAIGATANVNGNFTNSLAAGYGATATASNYVRFGNTSITVNAGQVAWTVVSDRRAKKDIEASDLGLDFIQSLKPVSYRLKTGNGRLDYGFIAQDVEQALDGRVTNMVTRENDKIKTYKLRASDIIAPAVRSVQELSAVNDVEARVLSKNMLLHKLLLMAAGVLISFSLGVYGGRILRQKLLPSGVSS